MGRFSIAATVVATVVVEVTVVGVDNTVVALGLVLVVDNDARLVPELHATKLSAAKAATAIAVFGLSATP